MARRVDQFAMPPALKAPAVSHHRFYELIDIFIFAVLHRSSSMAVVKP
jgi:hypothetical protein